MKRIIGAVCLLVLFVVYQTSITAFTHVHYVNGVIITHSHPFHGKHTHSKSELLVIGRLSTFQAPEVDVYEDLHPMRILLDQRKNLRVFFFKHTTSSVYIKRMPYLLPL